MTLQHAAGAKHRRKAVLVAAASALLVAMLGGLSTDIGPWYLSLKEPDWKPPDFLFGPVWTTIYALAAIAGVRGWERAPTRAEREWLLALFAFNAFVNVLWSLLFFRLHRPDWAQLEVGVLWASIALLMLVLRRYSPLSAWLLLPYLLWVTFAAALNHAVVVLNGPFGAS
jgi:tryptophan-rich sensory protein